VVQWCFGIIAVTALAHQDYPTPGVHLHVHLEKANQALMHHTIDTCCGLALRPMWHMQFRHLDVQLSNKDTFTVMGGIKYLHLAQCCVAIDVSTHPPH
jgi:hypothetical protein